MIIIPNNHDSNQGGRGRGVGSHAYSSFIIYITSITKSIVMQGVICDSVQETIYYLLFSPLHALAVI
jgi:hypothetical protein